MLPQLVELHLKTHLYVARTIAGENMSQYFTRQLVSNGNGSLGILRLHNAFSLFG
jgi:hypothetical protein